MITVSIIIRVEAEAEQQIPASGCQGKRCPDNCSGGAYSTRDTVRELEKEPRAGERAGRQNQAGA